MWLSIAAVVVVSVAFIYWVLDKMKMQTLDRYVLITGCDTGFGHTLAKSLDCKGCHVIATCLTTKGALDLNAASSERLKTVIMDVSSSDSINAGFEMVREILPAGTGLWGLVNNAGVAGNLGYYDWFKREEFRRILEVNLLGPVEVTNVFLPLVKRVKGRIVNVSSGIALTPTSAGGYELSKCGLEAFSDCLRQQMQHYGISVHIIQPTYFKTAIIAQSTLNDKLEMVWSRMTQEQRDEYGRECIDQCKRRVEEVNQAADNRLYLVTNAIEHALFARFPWRRYPVGGLVKFVARPLNILPAYMSDFVINLIFPLPKPQCCK